MKNMALKKICFWAIALNKFKDVLVGPRALGIRQL